MSLKQNVKIKIRQTNIDIFSNQILFELIDYLLINQDVNSKRFIKLEGTISQKDIMKNYNVIIKQKKLL